jgi:enoyl-CoA hydratase/carnithine racemase
MTTIEAPTAAEPVIIAQEGRILRITLNQPKRKNALTLAMYTAMANALVEAEGDSTVRVVLISGAGGSFTSGNDLMDFMKSPPTGEDSPVARFLTALASFTKPVVAAVAGPAIGVGTTMLLHCDFVLADGTAMFRLPFVNLALVPEAGSSLLLPGLVGHRVASELMLLGDAFDASAATSYGIVNRVVAADELDAEAMKIAGRLAAQPPAALRKTKALLKQPVAGAVREAMQREGAIFRERLASPEAMEAMQAFMAKRAPDFSRFS